MTGRSSTHRCHPGGGAGQEGSGCQPGGATHPAGAGGQPGGGLNRVVLAVLRPASPSAPACPAARKSLPHRLARSKSFSCVVVAIVTLPVRGSNDAVPTGSKSRSVRRLGGFFAGTPSF